VGPAVTRHFIILLVGLFVNSSIGAAAVQSAHQPAAEPNSALSPHPASPTTPKSLAQLLALPSADLSRVDIALVNLLCAEGLPGSERINSKSLSLQLDVWAAHVKAETDRHLYRVKDPRFADHYRHSETYFRIELLLQTLQEDLGVRYNPDRIYNPDASVSRDQFIHGAMDPTRGGTCSSMPVLYVAVGRRLGYPLKLVMARGHLFCRWDDGKGEKLNIEGTNGFSSYPDEFYHKWPYPLTKEDLAGREYLVSLTPAEELSVFMAARGHCFLDTHRFAEALEAYTVMNRLAPTFKVHANFLAMARLGATKGLEEFQRVYGKIPERIDPPPLPPEFANTPTDRR
jgi:regulator of sirC expression with transglutaminase-like and TPR domain